MFLESRCTCLPHQVQNEKKLSAMFPKFKIPLLYTASLSSSKLYLILYILSVCLSVWLLYIKIPSMAAHGSVRCTCLLHSGSKFDTEELDVFRVSLSFIYQNCGHGRPMVLFAAPAYYITFNRKVRDIDVSRVRNVTKKNDVSLAQKDGTRNWCLSGSENQSISYLTLSAVRLKITSLSTNVSVTFLENLLQKQNLTFGCLY